MLLLLLSTAFAQEAWLTEPVDLVRWPDGEPITVKALKSGSKVEILVQDEGADLVRVRSGIEFGWVPAGALTLEQPEDAVLPAGGLLDGLDLGPMFGGQLPGGMPSFPLAPPSDEPPSDEPPSDE